MSCKAAIVLVLSVAGSALAQSGMMQPTTGGDEHVPPWIAVQIADPQDPKVQAYAAQQRVRIETERELNKLRVKYFQTKKTDVRQAGILKLREFTDPAVYPSLLKLFEREGDDVRSAILDHLADQKTEQADTTIAWGAVFDKDPKFRAAAAERLQKRMRQTPDVSASVQTVIAEGLRRDGNDSMTAAAQLAQGLNLYAAIPMLINAQIGGGGTQVQTGGGGGDGESSLAWIMVGTQEAFVADLTPVVGDAAVAFDPTIGVVTEGVVLRVVNATVITYRTEIHSALIGLGSAGWDRRADFGWDNPRWGKWYNEELKPYLAEKQARQKAEANAKAAAARPTATANAPNSSSGGNH